MAVLPSFQGDGDTQNAPRKAGTCVILHIPISRARLADFAELTQKEKTNLRRNKAANF
jgi:hypothetical protein